MLRDNERRHDDSAGGSGLHRELRGKLEKARAMMNKENGQDCFGLRCTSSKGAIGERNGDVRAQCVINLGSDRGATEG